jgi:hypothetical protein
MQQIYYLITSSTIVINFQNYRYLFFLVRYQTYMFAYVSNRALRKKVTLRRNCHFIIQLSANFLSRVKPFWPVHIRIACNTSCFCDLFLSSEHLHDHISIYMQLMYICIGIPHHIIEYLNNNSAKTD